MDGIFPVATFTEPRIHRWDLLRPRPGLIVGLSHRGTDAGVFAMQDFSSDNAKGPYELKVFIPVDSGFRGWGGKWWPLSSIVRSFPDSEIAKHFSGITEHPENYEWIYPNLEPFVTEDWFQELIDATPDFECVGDEL